MDTILTGITGGYPMSIDVIEHLQNNVKKQASYLANGLSYQNQPVILWGGELTLNSAGLSSANVVTSQGALWYDDEIYFINNSLLYTPYLTESGLTSLEWDLLTEDNFSVIFKDGVTHTIFQDRTAILSLSSSTWTGVSGVSYFQTFYDDWTSVSFGSDFVNQPGSNTSYKRDYFGVVWVRGAFKKNTSGGLNETIFNLPEGYRPSGDEYLYIQTSATIDAARIEANGDFIIFSDDFTVPHYFSFSFRTDG